MLQVCREYVIFVVLFWYSKFLSAKSTKNNNATNDTKN